VHKDDKSRGEGKIIIETNLIKKFDIPEFKISEEEIERIVNHVLGSELDHEDDYSLSILNVNDETIKELNAQYRNKDESTDVLTFVNECIYEDEPLVELGDVFLSLETIKRQAEKFNNTFEREYTFMLIHGLLHLCEYDHEGSFNDHEEMFIKQQKYFDEL
jgi:probable rRNA maturation factor